MLNPGTIISDRYEIVRLIGEGGMGSVYEAKHRQIGKRVAIKLLSKDFSEDPETIKRFHQEAQIAGNIGHLNICEVMDFGVTGDGLPFIVMEYLSGESLSAILTREKRLPLDICLGIISQMLDALEEVHGKGIVHRDLKPENVVITNVKGHGLVVKLLDFGISKVLEPGPDSIRLTKTGTMMGTPYYMSPEQVRGRADVDHRTDIYTCGVMLYEMITGRVPYGGTAINEVFISIIEDSFPSPRKIIPELPPQVEKLLRRSMEKNPSKRLESASSFQDEINRLRAEIGDGKAAGIPSTKMASMVGLPTTPHRKPKAFIIAVLGGITALLAIITVGIILLVSSMGEKNPANMESYTIENKHKSAPHVTSKEKADTPPVPAKPEPEKIRIELSNAPENSRISYDGKIIKGNALDVEKNSQEIELRLSAKGFKDRVVKIVPSENLIIDGRLQSVEQKKEATETKAVISKDEPEKAVKKIVIEKIPEKQEPKPPPMKKKKKKIGHVWDYPE